MSEKKEFTEMWVGWFKDVQPTFIQTEGIIIPEFGSDQFITLNHCLHSGEPINLWVKGKRMKFYVTSCETNPGSSYEERKLVKFKVISERRILTDD